MPDGDLSVRVGAKKGEPIEFTLWPNLAPPLMAETVRAVCEGRGVAKPAWLASTDADVAGELAEALGVELRPWAA